MDFTSVCEEIGYYALVLGDLGKITSFCMANWKKICNAEWLLSEDESLIFNGVK